MRQIEKSKNVVNPWENGNDITKMSSISLTKHKKNPRTSSEDIFLPIHFSLFTLHLSLPTMNFFGK